MSLAALHAGLDATPHRRQSKVEHSLMDVVRSTSQRRILDRGVATAGKRFDVMKLQAFATRTSPPIRRNKAALITVPLRHRATHSAPDVARCTAGRRPSAIAGRG